MVSHSNPQRTYFLDIDGTLLKQKTNFTDTLDTEQLELLPKAREKVSDWHCQGHTIVIVTARCESMRDLTIKQLENAGIVYDMLIMGLSSGVRVLVNDVDSNDQQKAISYNVIRNIEGLTNVE